MALTSAQLKKKEQTRARAMKLLEKKPRVSASKRKEMNAAKRRARVQKKCKTDPAILSDKFKAAVPSARKIANMDYDDFLEMKIVLRWENTPPKPFDVPVKGSNVCNHPISLNT